MKREDYQHGMVKTYPVIWNSRPRLRDPDKLSTAGLFAKVPTKPTNHSKFTGKCGRSMCRECHSNPACKSKDKAKGAQKLRSSSNNTRSLSGFSTTTILDYIDGDYDCANHLYEGGDEEYINFTY
ncbi:uncharacterized protein LOC125194853 [Salvia hispanica]|uniref:uncharacterized protein LOC125194853 n=1 Tax=Salvia hispanica TaxID=49212 RepID=UPI00200972EF|nr:uncharacterized protein LOC125194853 [Salvia hispanica]